MTSRIIRGNGGHIVIAPKQRFHHRHEMPLDLAASLMHLTMVVGEAFMSVMKQEGMDAVRINYQDNGNWAYKEPKQEPQLHIHLYMRTTHEKHPAGGPCSKPSQTRWCSPTGRQAITKTSCL